MVERIQSFGTHKIIRPLSDDEEAQRLAQIVEIMSHSAPARAALAFWQDQNKPIYFARQLNDVEVANGRAMGAYLRAGEDSAIIIDPYISTSEAVSCLLHEIHHAFQDHQGLQGCKELGKPKNFIMGTRFSEAAAYAWQTHSCYQLMLDGYPAAWWGFQKDERKITEAYRLAKQEGKTDLEATRSAFDAFFESERRDFYDERSINAFSMVQEKVAVSLRQAGQYSKHAVAQVFNGNARGLSLRELERFGRTVESDANFITDTSGKTVQELVQKGGMSPANKERLRLLEQECGFAPTLKDRVVRNVKSRLKKWMAV